MKKALLVLLIYTTGLAAMASTPGRLPVRCPSKQIVTSQIATPISGVIAQSFPKMDKPKEKPKLETCDLVIIPIFWIVHIQCAADAWGGGGGDAF